MSLKSWLYESSTEKSDARYLSVMRLVGGFAIIVILA